MSQTQVTSAEFQKNFGTYKREALSKPVSITIHGKATLVMISQDHYEELMAGQAALAGAPDAESRQPNLEDELEELARMTDAGNDVQFADDPVDP